MSVSWVRRLSPVFLVIFVLSGLEAAAAAAAGRGVAASPVANAEADATGGRERPDAVSAMLTARASGKRIEDLSQRTETAQVFANPDGSWTSELDSEPVRVRDEAGEWHAIDTTLIAEGGVVRPRHALGDLRISGGGDQAFAQLTGRGKEVTWRWPGKLPKPTLEGDTATYSNVVPGGDLLVRATPTGFSHSIMLRERPQFTAGKPLRFEIPVTTGGARLERNPAGGLEVRGAKGAPLVSAPPPLMWDAKKNEEGDPERPLPVDVAVTQPGQRTPAGQVAGAAPVLTLTPDEAFLADPATQYPVEIDPSFTLYLYTDTWMYNRDFTTSQSASEDLRVGTWDDGWHQARSFIQFQQSYFTGKHVTSATLRLRNYVAGACAGWPIHVARITETWSASTITWANQPATSAADIASNDKGFGATNCPAGGDADFNVTAIAQGWAKGTFANYGVRMRAPSEASSNGTWRRYRSGNYNPVGQEQAFDPRMIIHWTYPPSTPMAPTTTGGLYAPPGSTVSALYVPTTTPRFETTVSDKDGGAVKALVEITNAAGARVTTCTSGWVAPNDKAGCTVPALAEGGTYWARATAFDNFGYYAGGTQSEATAAWSAKQPFTVASVTPQAPSVSCPTPYGDGTWSEAAPAAEVSCTITAAASGASAPGWVRYTIDGGVERQVKITPSADPAVAKTTVIVPRANGGHSITAEAESRSGQTSATASYALGWGTVGMAKPAAGTHPVTTTDTVPVQVAGPPSNSGTGTPAVSLKWRVAGTGLNYSEGWNTVGSDDLEGLSVTNDAAAGVSVKGTWDTRLATTDTSSAGGQSIALPPARPVLLEVQVCIDYPGDELPGHCSWNGAANRVLRVAHAFGGNFPVTDVPGGQVALWTGELAVAGSEASVSAPVAELSVSRTHGTYAGPAAHPAEAIFGPGWRANLDGPDAGLGGFTLVDNTLVDGTLVLDDGIDVPMVFGKTDTPARRTSGPLASGPWVALDEDTELAGITLKVDGTDSSAAVLVTEADGTLTRYTPQNAPSTTAAGVFVVDSITEPAAEGTTTFSRDSAGRVTRMLAPAPTGITCPATGALPAGCRALEIGYATTSTATAATPGDIAGQVKKLEQVVGGATETRTPLATYAYNSDQQLVAVTDPRNGLTTSYTYAGTSNRVATIKPPGLEPISYLYDADDKIARVKRDRPAGDPAGGTATLASFVYNVPTTGTTGLPDLDTTGVSTWGQPKTPTYAAAVFGPDQSLAGTSTAPADVPSSLWVDADLSYTDADGRVLNTASHGAGAWQYTSATYDEYGNITRSLDQGEIAAIKAGDLMANQAGTETRYNAEQKLNDAVVLPAGSVPVETWGTGRWILTQSGVQAWVRPHTRTELDEGAPNNGVNPATGQAYAQATTVTSDAIDAGGQVVETYSVTKTNYSTAVIDDNGAADAEAGWRMGLAGTVTTDMGGTGTDIVAQTRYDTAGRVIETRQPKSNGADAGTRKTAYYTPGTHPSINACENKPAWAGLECQTYYAAAPSSGPDLVTTRITGYNTDLQVLSSTEISGAAERTTTNTYRADGALTMTSTTVTGLAGSTPVGATSYNYDAATGLPTTTITAAAGGNPGGTITVAHDTWGRQTTYAPAAGDTTSTVFDAAGRVKTITDPKGATTYTYDGTDAAGNAEHRGLPTKLTVTRPGGTALEFTGAYNPAGGLTVQKLPGGVTQHFDYDPAGEPTGLSYTGTVAILDPDTGQQTGADPDGTWLAWSQLNDAMGRVRREWTPNGAAFTGDLPGAAATGYSRDYTYDRAARLIEVKDRTATPGQEIQFDADGNPVADTPACETRLYAFDTNGNRTGLTRRAGNTDGTCATTGGTVTASNYDTSDRLTTGAGGAGIYTYDQLGRVTSLPGVDTPNGAVAGNIGLGYYDTDAVKTLTQNGTTTTYGLDAVGRRSTETTGPTGAAPTTTVTRYYTDESDNPGSIETVKNGTVTVARFIEGLSGDLATEIDGNGAAKLNLANPHGDIVSSVELPSSGAATGVEGWTDTDEYGNARTGSTPVVGGQLDYTWLGAKQRARAGDTGLVLMGARLYNPVTGQFTSGDPVHGGNSTAYTYPQDPVNESDISGLCPLCVVIAVGAVIVKVCLRLCKKLKNLRRTKVGARLSVDDLLDSQKANLKRYLKKLPKGAEPVKITNRGGGSVRFSARVPGRVSGSYAKYVKTVDKDGKTTSYLKYTYGPDGELIHVKDKMR